MHCYLFCLLFRGTDKSMCSFTFPTWHTSYDDRFHVQRNTIYEVFIHFLSGVYEIASLFDFINFWLYLHHHFCPHLDTSYLGFLDTFSPKLSFLDYFSLFNLCSSVFILFSNH